MSKAVLLTAYGTPKSLEYVEQYYTHIRHGRKPSPEELRDLIERYKSIGGTSPLIQITERQRDKLQEKLLANGSKTKVYSAMKHSDPFIEDVIKLIVHNDIRELLCIALAPHYSKISIGSYIQIVDDTIKKLRSDLEVRWVRSWHNNPLLIAAWSQRIDEARAKIGGDCYVIFSAHSLPEKILSEGDPYKDQLLETASLIAQQSRINKWTFAFQSASKTGEPWLGPDIIDVLSRKREEGYSSFVVAPIGFVSDHLEILYDIDIECKDWAAKNGVRLIKARSLNDSEEFSECLYSIVKEQGFV
jgi:ferrochelatase